MSEKSTLWTDAGVDPRTFRERESGSHWSMNFRGNPYRPIPWCLVFMEKPARTNDPELSGTGDSQRDSRESIRANHSQLRPLFL